jgi:hypothetical protein
MRIRNDNGYLKVWLSSRDTYDWAHREGNSWPCSELSDRRVFAEFEPNGDLVDLAIDGKSDIDCDVTEFNAIMADHIAQRFPDHPAIK